METERSYRYALHLRRTSRHALLPGRSAPRLPQVPRRGDHLPRRRHHRLLAHPTRRHLAAGPQRRAAEAPAQGAQGDARRLHPGQPRRRHARLLRHAFRRHRDRAPGDPHHGRRAALPRHARRRIRRGRALCALARIPRRPRLRAGAVVELAAELRPPSARARLLVAVELSQAARQDGGQLHRRVREATSPTRPAAGTSTASSAATSTTRPSREIDGVPLRQHRRLGRELHRHLRNGDRASSSSCAGSTSCARARRKPSPRARSEAA